MHCHLYHHCHLSVFFCFCWPAHVPSSLSSYVSRVTSLSECFMFFMCVVLTQSPINWTVRGQLKMNLKIQLKFSEIFWNIHFFWDINMLRLLKNSSCISLFDIIVQMYTAESGKDIWCFCPIWTKDIGASIIILIKRDKNYIVSRSANISMTLNRWQKESEVNICCSHYKWCPSNSSLACAFGYNSRGTLKHILSAPLL